MTVKRTCISSLSHRLCLVAYQNVDRNQIMPHKAKGTVQMSSLAWGVVVDVGVCTTRSRHSCNNIIV